MVKQRDERGRFQGTKLRVIFGTQAEVVELLGRSTAYIERSHLTSRMFNGRQVRKTLAFSKDIRAYRASASWEDSYYNLIRPHKSLRLPVKDRLPQRWSPRMPAMAAKLTAHIWTVKELLMTLPLPGAINTREGDYRNSSQASIDWQFCAGDARIKLKTLYPSISD